MKMRYPSLLVSCLFLLAGCQNLEETVQTVLKNNPIKIPGASPSINAEDCGTPQKLLNSYFAAKKVNEEAAEEKFDGKWCRVSGTLTSISTYSFSIWSEPALDIDNKLACIQGTGEDPRYGEKRHPEVNRTRSMRSSLRNGQKIEVIGQIKMSTWRSNTYTRMLPLVQCRIVEK